MICFGCVVLKERRKSDTNSRYIRTMVKLLGAWFKIIRSAHNMQALQQEEPSILQHHKLSVQNERHMEQQQKLFEEESEILQSSLHALLGTEVRQASDAR